MDPVSQFVLGASVGTAVLGRRMGVRKAALAGGHLQIDAKQRLTAAVEGFDLR